MTASVELSPTSPSGPLSVAFETGEDTYISERADYDKKRTSATAEEGDGWMRKEPKRQNVVRSHVEIGQQRTTSRVARAPIDVSLLDDLLVKWWRKETTYTEVGKEWRQSGGPPTRNIVVHRGSQTASRVTAQAPLLVKTWTSTLR